MLDRFDLRSDGRRVPVMLDKITKRIERLVYGLDTSYIVPVCLLECKFDFSNCAQILGPR